MTSEILLKALSSRERDCLSLIGRGLGTKGVASELGIAPSTVEKHLLAARQKLGVRKTIEAVQALTFHLEQKQSLGSSKSSVVSLSACSEHAVRTVGQIMSSNSRHEAWQYLTIWLENEGYDQAIFGLVAEPFGQLTNGARLLESSFSKEVMEIYELVGGANSDPVAHYVAGALSKRVSPFFCNSVAIIDAHIERAPPEIAEMLMLFRDLHAHHLYVVPNTDVSTGAPFSLTVNLNAQLSKEVKKGKILNLNDLRVLAETYWSFIKSNSHLAKLCNLTRRQSEALSFVARGFTNEETAERMCISSRSAEKLLQSTRAQLGAPTTASAIFRASVYGVFSYRQ